MHALCYDISWPAGHVKNLSYDTGTAEPVYHYAAVPSTTYQSYDHGSYGSGGGGGYGGGGGGYSSAYKRRTAEEGREFQSPSTFEFLTKLVKNAVDKYGPANEDE